MNTRDKQAWTPGPLWLGAAFATAYFQTLLRAAERFGGVLYLPPGEYVLL